MIVYSIFARNYRDFHNQKGAFDTPTLLDNKDKNKGVNI